MLVKYFVIICARWDTVMIYWHSKQTLSGDTAIRSSLNSTIDMIHLSYAYFLLTGLPHTSNFWNRAFRNIMNCL